jgi:hypothetical protein
LVKYPHPLPLGKTKNRARLGFQGSPPSDSVWNLPFEIDRRRTGGALPRWSIHGGWLPFLLNRHLSVGCFLIIWYVWLRFDFSAGPFD